MSTTNTLDITGNLHSPDMVFSSIHSELSDEFCPETSHASAVYRWWCWLFHLPPFTPEPLHGLKAGLCGLNQQGHPASGFH